jgi:hypothetical protein
MRSLRLAIPLALALAACGGDSGGDPSGADAGVDAPPLPTNGFRITTPSLTIRAGEEVTYCYYTTIDVAEAVGVKRWSSTMTPGSHHLILYFGDTGKADGTVDQDCGGLSGTNVPYWTYSAQNAVSEAVMPAGIGMTVPARQKVYVQMHYLNAGDQDLQANAIIDGETYPSGMTYTPAAAYITYNTQINIPANSTGFAGGSCTVPSGAKFFTMSTHVHKRGIATKVKDGGTVADQTSGAMVFESTDWEHPGVRNWTADPFYSFASGKLTYRCDYDNQDDVTVTEGQSAATDEMCMAVGYFFPATAPKFCINSFAVP